MEEKTDEILGTEPFSNLEQAVIYTSSPRHGRPIQLIREVSSTSMHINEDLENPPENVHDTAYAVPETPVISFRKIPVALNLRCRVFSQDEDTRHEICQHSLIPWTYLLNIPGKNVRDEIIQAFNVWLNVNAEHVDTIKQVVGYLHSASLIIDDIEDESLMRRGKPAAHVQFGVARALNAGNCTYRSGKKECN